MSHEVFFYRRFSANASKRNARQWPAWYVTKVLHMKNDPRFLKEDGCEVFTGNELLIKGALEAEGGTHLLTGYPGSPVAGFFDAMELVAPLFREKGIKATIANNEALGAAMLNGSQMSNLRGICCMKSVGFH